MLLAQDSSPVNLEDCWTIQVLKFNAYWSVHTHLKSPLACFRDEKASSLCPSLVDGKDTLHEQCKEF